MSSDATRDELVMGIVERALGLPPNARGTYLREACAGDETLLEETSDRILREERMNGFLLDLDRQWVKPEQGFFRGQVLCDRFEIVGQVGEGGMAWVYEAIDRRLDQRIAIKFPKPVFSDHLLPETVSALKLAHDNVCRVHEIHRAIIDSGEVEFLTMELLEGETLRDRMDGEKHLTTDEIETIARQICAGLEAAHRKGIIHGDLKPNNIMLTKTAAGELRVVITDFGLARSMLENGPQLTHSPLFGTPHYIAPELLERSSRSVASDLFALGVVFSEMLGENRPWNTNSPAGTAASTELPMWPEIPRRWHRLIARCLEPDAAARPLSARAVLAELEGKRPSAPTWWAAGGAVAVCVSAGLWLRPIIFPPVPLHSIRVAVLSFEADAASQPIADGFARDVSDRLARIRRGPDGMTVIPQAETARNHVRTAKQARSALGATHALEAEFRQAGGKLSAHAALRDTRTEQIVRSFSAEYALFEMALPPKALLGTVTAGLRLEGVSIPETVDAAAYAEYVQGLHYLRDDEHLTARAIPFFERAAKLDRGSALPYAGIATAQVLMFETSRDREWLTRAERSLNNAVARNPDALEVDLAAGLLKKAEGQPERALDDFRRAVQLEPDNVDALRRLAENYGDLGLTREALETYEQAISSRPEDYHPHMNLGVYQYDRGQYAEALAQFQIVTGLAPGLAQAHLNLGGAYATLGRFAEAETEMRAALMLREDRDTWIALGAVLAYEKRHSESAAAYEKAVALGPAIPLALSNLADAYRRCGRIADSLKTYRVARQVTEQELQAGDPGNRSGPVRAFASYVSARLGDRTGAEREIQEALRLSPENADVRRRAVLVFEILERRIDALKILKSGPKTFIEDLSRHPDLSGLQADRHFISLRSKVQQ